ncbi:MAG: 3-ketoacyl-ACP reductase [Acetobacteraceae bacterium]
MARPVDGETAPPRGRGVALVTGAGSGLGHATSMELLQAGFDVAMAGLDATPAEGLPEAIPPGRRLRYYQFDLADIGTHAALLGAVEAELGELTCLVNNAGVTSLVRGDLLEITPASFDRCVGVNLRGTFFLSQAVARRLLSYPRHPYPPHRDALPRSIIIISSANAEIVGEDRGDYCISKAGLAMMTKLFASRLAAHGIAVFEIRPGIIATGMTAPASERYTRFIAAGGVPARRWGRPGDVAVAVSTLARGEIPFSTGIHVDVGGGLQIHRV